MARDRGISINVRMPIGLVKELETYIRTAGYRTRQEVIVQAVVQFLETKKREGHLFPTP